MNTEQSIAKIATKNDEYRRNMTGCTVTRGIVAMGPAVNEIFVRVRDFSSFAEDNDPYEDYDFGFFEILGQKVFWKIDYDDEEEELKR